MVMAGMATYTYRGAGKDYVHVNRGGQQSYGKKHAHTDKVFNTEMRAGRHHPVHSTRVCPWLVYRMT